LTINRILQLEVKRFQKGAVYKRHPQSGGFIQCAAHFAGKGGLQMQMFALLAQKKLQIFSKFMVSPYVQGGGVNFV